MWMEEAAAARYRRGVAEGHAGPRAPRGQQTSSRKESIVARLALPDVGEILHALRHGVEERLGRRRRLYTGEDLIDEVGLTPDQFIDLVADMESRFGVVLDPESADQLTVAGALLVRLVRRSCEELEETEDEAA
jgi:hypothetical protein